MKIKIKHGNTRFNISYMDIFKKLNSNLFESMNSKSNSDLFNSLYINIPKSMISYYKELNKIYGKYVNADKPTDTNTVDRSDILTANGHDIYNYVARYGLANYQLQAILKFDGRLDFTKLSKAVRLSIDEEPVFGCRFVEGNPPYWRYLKNIDKTAFCSFEVTSNTDEAIQRFLESPLDMDNDPMVKIKLIRSESYDILGVKINHACCDGAGVKSYIQLLAEIYSNIDYESGIFIPIPGTRGRRDQDRLFRELGITDPEAFWIPGSDISIPTWTFPWKHSTSNDSHIVVVRLAPGQLEEMSRFARSREATINDLILTAYYRAMLKMGEPAYGMPMGIPITVDLRRYLPNGKTDAIRNFSGSVNTWLTLQENESFDNTLSKVVNMMNQIKGEYPGLQSAIGLERLEKISFQEALAYYQATSQCPVYYGDKCVPTLSNLGFISKSVIKFGNKVVTDAYIVPPVVRAPGLLLMVCTYNGIITLSAGFYEKTVLRNDVERLLSNIKSELSENCKP